MLFMFVFLWAVIGMILVVVYLLYVTNSGWCLVTGLPGAPPTDFRMQRFWYTTVTIGQMLRRLVWPYMKLPLKLSQLIDTDISAERRLHMLRNFLGMEKCCVDQLCAWPLLDDVRQNGGEESLFNEPVKTNLEMIMRSKVSNIEVELNFSRAASSRQAMRGKAHSIASMTAKHISAEVKLSQRRLLLKKRRPLCIKSIQGRGKLKLGNPDYSIARMSTP